jgi:hypothetical protein
VQFSHFFKVELQFYFVWQTFAKWRNYFLNGGKTKFGGGAGFQLYEFFLNNNF